MKKLSLIFIFVLLSLFNLSLVSALSAEVIITEKYIKVNAGERFYFQVNLKYPENPSRKDLRINYEILKDSELVAQAKVLKAIETQMSFMEFIIIPEHAESGMYELVVKITDYESLNEEVSATFDVDSKKEGGFRTYFFVIIGVNVLIGLLIMLQVYVLRKSLRSKRVIS